MSVEFDHVDDMNYQELQKAAKRLGIKANQKACVLRDELKRLALERRAAQCIHEAQKSHGSIGPQITPNVIDSPSTLVIEDLKDSTGSGNNSETGVMRCEADLCSDVHIQVEGDEHNSSRKRRNTYDLEICTIPDATPTIGASSPPNKKRQRTSTFELQCDRTPMEHTLVQKPAGERHLGTRKSPRDSNISFDELRATSDPRAALSSDRRSSESSSLIGLQLSPPLSAADRAVHRAGLGDACALEESHLSIKEAVLLVEEALSPSLSSPSPQHSDKENVAPTIHASPVSDEQWRLNLLRKLDILVESKDQEITEKVSRKFSGAITLSTTKANNSKAPNWQKIHEGNFAKMKDISSYLESKKRLAAQSRTPFSARNPREHQPSASNSRTLSTKAVKTLDNDLVAVGAITRGIKVIPHAKACTPRGRTATPGAKMTTPGVRPLLSSRATTPGDLTNTPDARPLPSGRSPALHSSRRVSPRSGGAKIVKPIRGGCGAAAPVSAARSVSKLPVSSTKHTPARFPTKLASVRGDTVSGPVSKNLFCPVQAAFTKIKPTFTVGQPRASSIQGKPTSLNCERNNPGARYAQDDVSRRASSKVPHITTGEERRKAALASNATKRQQIKMVNRNLQ